ncbi:50S ribosomal protein L3, variant [Fonticula alba]|uniref:Large ribosomal subunit protein uL3m n=1 Tax=Fonticula alba TaxID=691883 RepID=A0A058ZDQ4_FONAL|nr:50S ribosomal protein L3 [Fonticula alba]XP_009492226.1 50S ribosomal protein L3, variant [Fonticula alba]KCV72524.1 50S ribosomal protein L3 [Fonticula alba]KCV72525.1 50S ribosomal protein L3, variant [Fonticula alba]|eukprot:XP_009492225.1 50S ribosomal protein L3 [Fonticula alba]
MLRLSTLAASLSSRLVLSARPAAVAAAPAVMSHLSAATQPAPGAAPVAHYSSRGKMTDEALFQIGVKVSPFLTSEGISSDIIRAQAKVATTQNKWEKGLVRTGTLAVKLGMTSLYDEHGTQHGATVLHMNEVQVLEHKTMEKHGYTALKVGAVNKRGTRWNKARRGQFDAIGISRKHVTGEFRCSPEALLPVGHVLEATHFYPGQYIDVTSVSVGKGFQGPMKRWNFGGNPATHGVSKSHRSHGGTGACQDPGRIFKNKKMAGRMGGKRVTAINLQVLKVDTVLNLLYVKGAVPGSTATYVRVRDAAKKAHLIAPAFPTFQTEAVLKEAGIEELPRELLIPKVGIDPNEYL